MRKRISLAGIIILALLLSVCFVSAAPWYVDLFNWFKSDNKITGFATLDDNSSILSTDNSTTIMEGENESLGIMTIKEGMAIYGQFNRSNGGYAVGFNTSIVVNVTRDGTICECLIQRQYMASNGVTGSTGNYQWSNQADQNEWNYSVCESCDTASCNNYSGFSGFDPACIDCTDYTGTCYSDLPDECLVNCGSNPHCTENSDGFNDTDKGCEEDIETGDALWARIYGSEKGCQDADSPNTTIDVNADSIQIPYGYVYGCNEINEPLINLIEPIDNDQVYITTINFTFNVSDESGIANCSLLFDDEVNYTMYDVERNIIMNITKTLPYGIYNWSIGCYDNVSNYNVSEYRRLIVSEVNRAPNITSFKAPPVVSGFTGQIFNETFDFSNSSIPTDEGDNVNFYVNATDYNGNDYRLMICTSGNIESDLTCSAAMICNSSYVSSGSLASCTNNTLGKSNEAYTWYSFICDNQNCSGPYNHYSPYNVNHKPTITSPTTSGNQYDTSIITCINGTASDSDTEGGQDTASLNNYRWYSGGADPNNLISGQNGNTLDCSAVAQCDSGIYIKCSHNAIDNHNLEGDYSNSSGVLIKDSTIVSNNIDCYNGSIWKDCSAIKYGETIEQVRANCVDSYNASFKLENIPDNDVYFDVGEISGSGWIMYNNDDVVVNESGDWNISVVCENENTTRQGNSEWLVNWGTLNAINIDPLNDFGVGQYSIFNFTTNITCNGGECEDINAWIKTDDEDVPENSGTPAYTLDSNPDLLCTNMYPGQSCQTRWRLNATGNIGGYNITVTYSSSNSNVANSSTNVIVMTIQDSGAPVVTLTSPDDPHNNTDGNQMFTAEAVDASNISNCSLYTNITGQFMINDTEYGDKASYSFQINSIPDDTLFVWNVQCCDNMSNCAFAEDNRTVRIMINDAPYITSPNPIQTNIAMDETDSYPFSIVKNDDDWWDTVSVTWYVNGTLNKSGTSPSYDFYTFYSGYESAGVYNITVVLEDLEGLTDEHTWTLIVNNKNRDPVISSFNFTNSTDIDYDSNVIANENSLLEFAVNASDPDDDALGYYWYIDDVLNETGSNAWQWQTDYDDNGTYNISVKVNDTYGATVWQNWSLVIKNNNRAPNITSYAPIILIPSIDEGDNLTFNATAIDYDGDDIGYYWFVNGSLEQTNGNYTFEANETSAGVYNITLIVNDSFGDSDSLTWILNVSIVNSNASIDAYHPLANPIINETESQEFNITASDADNSIPTAQWLLNGTPVDSDYSYTYNSDYTSAGSYNVTVLLTDVDSGQVTDRREWLLVVTNVNRIPVIHDYNFTNSTDIDYDSNVIGKENSTLVFAVNASDLDVDDSIGYYWYIDDMLNETSSNTWQWQTDYDDNGTYNISLKVNDTYGASVWQNWSLIINNQNRAPNITYYAPISLSPSIDEGQNLTLNITAIDYDGDNINIYWYENETLKQIGSNYTFITNETSAGSYGVSVLVNDTYGDYTLLTWIITVNAVNSNATIYTYYPLANPIINETESQEFNITASDADNSIPTAQWLLNGTPVDSDYSYTYNSDYTSAGNYNVTVLLTDVDSGQVTDRREWIFTITNVNRYPQITQQVQFLNLTDQHGFIANASATDPDGLSELQNCIVYYYNASHNFSKEGDYSSGKCQAVINMSDGFSIFEKINVSIEFTDIYGASNITENRSNSIPNNNPSVTDVLVSPGAPTTLQNLTCSYTFSDPDGDENNSIIRWYKEDLEQISLENVSLVLSGNTSNDETWNCTVIPLDNYGGIGASKSYAVIIGSTAPYITETLDVFNRTGHYFNITAKASDADGVGDIANCSLWHGIGAPSSIKNGIFNNVTGRCIINLSIYDGYDVFDAITVKLQFTDKSGKSINTSVKTNAIPNYAPDINKVFIPLVVNETDWLNVSFAATDADGDVINYKIYRNDSEQASTNISDWLTTYDDAGYYEYKLVANDSYESDINYSYVTILDVNRAPIIYSYNFSNGTDIDYDSDVIANEGDSLDFVINASDPDGEAINYYWYFDDVLNQTGSKLWQWQPGFDNNGTYNITVKVNDSQGLYDVHDWTLVINNKNRAPNITGYTPLNLLPIIFEGQNMTFNVSTTDYDGDAMNIYWYVNSSLEQINGEYEFEANATSEGHYNITALVNDTFGDYDVMSWILEVVGTNQNATINTFYPAVDPVINETDSQEFNITAHDDDGSSPTAQWLLNGSNEASGYTYTYNSDYTSAGSYNVTVLLTDVDIAQVTDRREWILTIKDVNQVPVIVVDISLNNFSVGHGFNISARANDGDDNLQSCRLFYGYGSSLDNIKAGNLDGLGNCKVSLENTTDNLAGNTAINMTVEFSDSESAKINTSYASNTLSNNDPTINFVNVQPADANELDNLSCNYSISDMDSDDFIVNFDWFIDGISLGLNMSNISYGNTSIGDNVSCKVTATDTFNGISSDKSSNITIIPSNQPPVVDAIVLTNLTNLHGFHVFANATDINANFDSCIVWHSTFSPPTTKTIGSIYINGNYAECRLNLTNSTYNVDDNVYVKVQFNDTYGYSVNSSISSNHISNIKPTVVDVSIVPSSPTAEDDLSCSYNVIEPENDAYYTNIFWYNDDVLVPELNNLTNISYTNTSNGEEWYCNVSAVDSYGLISAYNASSSITIQNITAWTNLTLPEGIYSIKPAPAPDYGTFKYNFTLGFDDFTSSAGNEVKCYIEESDCNGGFGTCTILELNKTVTSTITNGNFNITHELQPSDVINTSQAGTTSIYVPWEIKNCSLYKEGNLLYTNNISWRIHVHPTNWSSGDIANANNCYNEGKGQFFLNTVKCDFYGDVAFASFMYSGTKVEGYCHDNIDNNDIFPEIDCNDDNCKGITYSCLDKKDLDNNTLYYSPSGSHGTLASEIKTGDIDSVVSDVATSNTDIQWTQHSMPNGTFKIRFRKWALDKIATIKIKGLPEIKRVNKYAPAMDQANGLMEYFINGSDATVDTDVLEEGQNYANEIWLKSFITDQKITNLDTTLNVTFLHPELIDMSEGYNVTITLSYCEGGSCDNYETYIDVYFDDPTYGGTPGGEWASDNENEWEIGLGVSGITWAGCNDTKNSDFDYLGTGSTSFDQSSYDCYDIDCDAKQGPAARNTYTGQDTKGLCSYSGEHANDAMCFDEYNNDWHTEDTTYGHLNTNVDTMFTDCRDSDCDGVVNPANASQICEHSIELNCSDGFDNDHWQVADCNRAAGADYNSLEYDCAAYCRATIDSSEKGSECDDGIDNDWDKYYTDGGGRTGYSLNTTYGAGMDCAWGSGADEDCDNEILSNGKRCELNNESTCDDSFDNDYDDGHTIQAGWSAAYYNQYFGQFGMTYSSNADCDDYDCYNKLNCPTDESLNLSWCFDGADNDLDGLIDCADSDCLGKTNPENENETCYPDEFLVDSYQVCNNDFMSFTLPSNVAITPRDDDGDGNANCQDSSCKQAFGNCGPCPDVENVTYDSCANSKDDDLDANIDCADTDCYGMIGNYEGALCSSEENSDALCSDGFDNDNDGGADCADSNCRNNNFASCSAAENCNDAVDNNGNGLIDCQDSTCLAACDLVTDFSSTLYGPSTDYLSLDNEKLKIYWNNRVRKGSNHTVRFTFSDPYTYSQLTLGNLGGDALPVGQGLQGNNFALSGPDASLFETQNYNENGAHDKGQIAVVDSDDGGSSLDVTINIPTDSAMSQKQYELITLINSKSITGNLLDVLVLDDIAPTIDNVVIQPSSLEVEYGDTFWVRAKATDPDNGDPYEGEIYDCRFKITGPGGYSHTTSSSSCQYTSNAITSSGTYTVNVTARDATGNYGSVNSTSYAITVKPKYVSGTNTYPMIPWYKNGQSMQVSADFKSEKAISGNSCTVYREGGISLGTITATKIGDSVSCNGTVNVPAVSTNMYKIYVNITDANSNTAKSDNKVVHVCDTSYSGICKYADFDLDGAPEGIKYKYNDSLVCDNCPNTYNPDQYDSDGDGVGDVCEDMSPHIDNKIYNSREDENVTQVDLWAVTRDADNLTSELIYILLDQSNSSFINCNIISNRYIGCSAPGKDLYGYNNLSINISDGEHYTIETIKMNVLSVIDFNVTSPVDNNTYYGYFVGVNFTADEIISSAWYHLDNETDNITIPTDDINAYKLAYVKEFGNHSIRLYAKNSNNIVSEKVINFTTQSQPAWVQGYVSDENNYIYRAGVKLIQHGSVVATYLTNESGFYKFKTVGGDFIVKATKYGYDNYQSSVTLTPGSTTTNDIGLTPSSLSGSFVGQLYIIDSATYMPLDPQGYKVKLIKNIGGEEEILQVAEITSVSTDAFGYSFGTHRFNGLLSTSSSNAMYRTELYDDCIDNGTCTYWSKPSLFGLDAGQIVNFDPDNSTWYDSGEIMVGRS